ncbi:MAG: glycan-binding surface protein [Bacteroidota bacterium]|nr:glycan-binding surface protein [Bacteroidota bacterium]
MKRKTLFLILALTGFLQYACKKNSGGGTPVITSVRTVDSTKRDSFFVKAYPGTMIVIDGNNLGGVQAIFFNDTSAFFNPVYNTSTHIIVSIPATAQTAATNSKVPSILKVVTDHGTATYSFTLVLPPPFINSISFDNSGTGIFINGGNFVGVTKVTFPGGDTALGFTVNKAGNQIAAKINPLSNTTDSLRVFAYYGVASFPYPPPMTISSITNENGIAGDVITVTGTNFVNLSSVIFPGNIAGTNLTQTSFSEFSVTVPPGITTSDYLHINGILGTVASPQPFDSDITHPNPGYLSTFDVQYNSDNQGFVGWTGGYAPAPATAYPNATGSVAFLTNGSPMGANTNAGSQGNPGFIQLEPQNWVSNTSASVAGYNLKFELFVAKPWTAGAVWVFVGGWYNWHDYAARYAPWETATGGVFNPSGWITVTIPISAFTQLTGTGTSAMHQGNVESPNKDNNAWDLQTFPSGGAHPVKFSDFPTTELCFALLNDGGTAVPANGINIAIDNVRIVQGQ